MYCNGGFYRFFSFLVGVQLGSGLDWVTAVSLCFLFVIRPLIFAAMKTFILQQVKCCHLYLFYLFSSSPPYPSIHPPTDWDLSVSHLHCLGCQTFCKVHVIMLVAVHHAISDRKPGKPWTTSLAIGLFTVLTLLMMRVCLSFNKALLEVFVLVVWKEMVACENCGWLVQLLQLDQLAWLLSKVF